MFKKFVAASVVCLLVFTVHSSAIAYTRQIDVTGHAQSLRQANVNNNVIGAIWNKDETHILTWSGDTTARVWDAHNGKLLLTLPHSVAVVHAQWNGDETRILTASLDRTVRVWDATTGKVLLTLANDDTSTSSSVLIAWWSKDGTRLMTWASYSKLAHIWSVPDGALLQTFNSATGFSWVQWNSDETHVFTSSLDSFRVWDATSGKLLSTISPQQQIVKIPQWDQHETRVLTISADKTVDVWDMTNGRLLSTLTYGDQVEWAAWNKDGTRIVAVLTDNTIHMWDIAARKELFNFLHSNTVWSVTWNQAETRLLSVSLDNTARISDATNGKLLLTFSHPQIRSATWNKDETRLMT